MSWFKREGSEPDPTTDPLVTGERSVRTEGLWIKCDGCRQILWKADLEANLNVCPKCARHFRISARQRLDMLLEPGYTLVDGNLCSTDPLQFTDIKSYQSRLSKAKASTGLLDAILNAEGQLAHHAVIVSAMEYAFIGGSMGAVVGETIARAIDRSLATRKPLIIISASGGARMMEGVASLMQLAKISAGLAKMDDEAIPYLCVLTDPTTGGVTASFAMLGDLNIAEPGALIGFAGPRVIEQTIRQKLPEGFQRSEFLLEHGMLDAVVDRRELKAFLVRSLDFMQNEHVSARSQ
jgi:acetyl-CoA carboxylase carboxyl transferase subunit beta